MKEPDAKDLGSSNSDKLIDTVDYVLLNKIVKEEMSIPSKLLETVGKRILNRVFLESNLVTKVIISISKINPPIIDPGIPPRRAQPISPSCAS